MQISTYAQGDVESGVLVSRTHPFLLISLRDPGESVALPPAPACVGVLTIECRDHEMGTSASGGFLPAHAQQIVYAVTCLPPTVEEIVVHCQAGISRSPAVAAALAHLFGVDDTPFLSFPKYPNRQIYRTLCAALSRTYAQENRERLHGEQPSQTITPWELTMDTTVSREEPPVWRSLTL